MPGFSFQYRPEALVSTISREAEGPVPVRGFGTTEWTIPCTYDAELMANVEDWLVQSMSGEAAR